MARIGILGGTFDPPHYGHIAIAEAALKELELSRVLFIPAKIPPHKQRRSMASAEDRTQMLRLAIEGHPGFELSDIELRREGPSYTADTLEQLKKIYPDDSLVLIIGSDNVSEIEGWYQPDRILGLATVAAANRPDFIPSGKFARQVSIFPMPPMAISSTDIRGRIKAGISIAGLLPPKVESYIFTGGLYLDHE